MSELIKRAGKSLTETPTSRGATVSELEQRVVRLQKHRRNLQLVSGAGVAVLLIAALSLGRSAPPDPEQTASTGEQQSGATGPAVASPTVPPDTTSTATATDDPQPTCDDTGCGPWDPIPIAPGVADYYVHSADLETGSFLSEVLPGASRCLTIDDTGTCQKLEGLSQRARLITAPDGGALSIGGDDPAAENTSIQTTSIYTDITPQAFAEQAALTGAGVAPLTMETIRGQQGVRWDYDVTSNVAWQETPGVIVWVSVSTDLADRLMEIADGVRRVDGPLELGIPVVVPGSGPAWTGLDNNATGFVIARFQGRECLGWMFIERCDGAAATSQRTAGGYLVSGSTQGAASIEVTGSAGTVVRATVLSTPSFTTQAFVAVLGQDVPESIRYLDAQGNELAAEAFAEEASVPMGFIAPLVDSGRTNEQLWWLGADLDADRDVASSLGQNGFYRPSDDPMLCTYFNLTGSDRVFCTAPGGTTAFIAFDGFVFGSVGTEVDRVLVNGEPVGLLTDERITDRRFFVAGDGEVALLDASGNPVTPDPIIATNE